MNTGKLNTRLSLSMAGSLMLHLLALVSLHFYLHFLKAVPKPVERILHVRLEAVPPLAHPLKQVQKLLTTHAPSPVKVVQSPTPHPEIAAPSQSEHIAGISMPRSIASPLNPFAARGDAFPREQLAQQNAMRAYQEYAMAEQARQQAEQKSRLLTMQLKEALEQQFLHEPIIAGKCTINTSGIHFECDSSELTREALTTERITLGIFMSLRKLGRAYSGFIVNNQPGNPAVILLNERLP